MEKSIKTLVRDIYEVVLRKDGWFTDELAAEFSKAVSLRLQAHFNEEQAARLRLSQMGPKCPKALWLSVNKPETAAALPPWAMIKYSQGHIAEAMVIMLAKAAGHRVEGMQDRLEVEDVYGHRDVVIDGCLVDVKSCSSRSFDKFKDRSIAQDDPFGYLDQLDGYSRASLQDDLVRVKDKSYILALDLVKGHLFLYEHTNRPTIVNRIREYKGIVAQATPPACTCRTVPEGKSGNMKLDTRASYSAYRFECFPLLRTFIYADGPKYLSKVERVPDVKEINRYGRELPRAS
jgi:hypothetical protein